MVRTFRDMSTGPTRLARSPRTSCSFWSTSGACNWSSTRTARAVCCSGVRFFWA
uniref:Uncharacterized protein n=1 Tax=uncultured marine virus TaxID=186617 RepID=A0A0F7L6P4_9VIRU|nr:hypothetical protein [uncultured marine virus]